MKIKTVEELVSICKEIKGKSVSECNAIAAREGVNAKFINHLRSVLGYTVPRPPRYPETLKKEVIGKITDGGQKLSDVASEYGLSLQLVYEWLSRSGIDYKVHDFWSPIRVKSLCHMIINGNVDYKNIASKLGCTKRMAAAMAYNIKNRKTKKWCEIAEEVGLYRYLDNKNKIKRGAA